MRANKIKKKNKNNSPGWGDFRRRERILAAALGWGGVWFVDAIPLLPLGTVKVNGIFGEGIKGIQEIKLVSMDPYGVLYIIRTSPHTEKAMWASKASITRIRLSLECCHQK